MSFSLVVSNESGPDLTAEQEQLLHRVADLALQLENMPDDVEIGLVLVDDDAIARLNAQYRNVDSATDVLSFPLFAADELERLQKDPASFPERPLLIGDIVVSVPTAARQAVQYGHGYERELAFLFVHGLLHLLGYDHDDEPARQRMRRSEESILHAAGASR